MEVENGENYRDNEENDDHNNKHGLSVVNGGQRGNVHMTEKVRGEDVVT